MYGFNYVMADTEASLDKALNSFYDNAKRPKLLEVFTPSQVNDEVLLDYFKFIK